jgi:hypothetical protein
MVDREHRLNVLLTAAEIESVRALAEELGVTQSALVRRLVASARVTPRGERSGARVRLVVPVAGGGSPTTRAAGVEPDADPLTAWPAFAEAVRARLEAGRAAYGDRSFSREPAELLGELEQEVLDLAGWGFVLFQRLEAMRAALAEVTP